VSRGRRGREGSAWGCRRGGSRSLRYFNQQPPDSVSSSGAAFQDITTGMSFLCVAQTSSACRVGRESRDS
jgi:hypothetical protein